jgi:hypothetical protein
MYRVVIKKRCEKGKRENGKVNGKGGGKYD